MEVIIVDLETDRLYIKVTGFTVSPNEILNETTSTNFKSSFLKNHYG